MYIQIIQLFDTTRYAARECFSTCVLRKQLNTTNSTKHTDSRGNDVENTASRRHSIRCAICRLSYASVLSVQIKLFWHNEFPNARIFRRPGIESAAELIVFLFSNLNSLLGSSRNLVFKHKVVLYHLDFSKLNK